MRQKFSESDLPKLVGKFVIEINNEKEGVDITVSKNPGFWLEKRIRFIAAADTRESKYLAAGLFYSTGSKDPDEFLEWINSEDNGRHVRLLNKREMKWLFKQMYKIQSDSF